MKTVNVINTRIEDLRHKYQDLEAIADNMHGRKGVVKVREDAKKAKEIYEKYKYKAENLITRLTTPPVDIRLKYKEYIYSKKQMTIEVKECKQTLFDLLDNFMFFSRGDYQQVKFNNLSDYLKLSYENYASVDKSRLLRSLKKISNAHPNIKTMNEITKLIDISKKNKIWLKEYQDWDYDGTGKGLTNDIYGYCKGLLLVQERSVARQYEKSYLSMKKIYYVTDGKKYEVVKCNAMWSVLKTDSSLEGAIKAISKKLSKEWQDKLSN